MGQRRTKLENYINEAINNIRDDRDRTTTLLSDVMSELQAPTSTYESHKDLGLIAAKYLETLQRSNEQLVKLTSMMQKNIGSGSESLSEKDKNELFDILQGAG
jgi:hypothetical protein